MRLSLAGAPAIPVHYLRTFADSRAIIANAAAYAKRALVIGASFIGLEVAASLRTRRIDVHVVAPEREPLERVMGPEVGRFVRGLHEKQRRRLPSRRDRRRASMGASRTLSGGATVDADLVSSASAFARRSRWPRRPGSPSTRHHVDEYLQTSAPGIFAAGDIARWPDPHTGERIRVEHWVVAERQGQAAARNILGQRERFSAVPFFWSQHYDISINYVGHAEQWDAADIDGDLSTHDAVVTYKKDADAGGGDGIPRPGQP